MMNYKEFNINKSNVGRSINGKRGQAYLKELLYVLDSMDTKALLKIDRCLFMYTPDSVFGVMLKSRGGIDPYYYHYQGGHTVTSLSKVLNISRGLVAEIIQKTYLDEDNGDRWRTLRTWVAKQIKQD